MQTWGFFRLVRFRGGKTPYLQWYEEHERPIVVMTPVIKLTEGPNFVFGARWALMQYHAWDDRQRFLNLTDREAADYFRAWRTRPECPPYIQEQYLVENGRSARGGAGPSSKKNPKETGPAVAEDQAQSEYDAKMAVLLSKRDFAGAAALKEEFEADKLEKQILAMERLDDHEGWEGCDWSETEEGGADGEEVALDQAADTRVLKLLYKVSWGRRNAKCCCLPHCPRKCRFFKIVFMIVHRPLSIFRYLSFSLVV